MELIYELDTVAKSICEIDKVVRKRVSHKVIYKEKLQKPQFEKDTGIEPELLWALFWGNGYTVSYISKLFHCGQVTIREGMKQYNIPCPGYSYYDEELMYETLCETKAKCDRRRRLKEKTLSKSFTEEEWFSKVDATNGICSMCGRPYEEGGGLTLDHILPVSKAPFDFCYTIDDIAPLCKSCNSSKSDKLQPYQPKGLNVAKSYHICNKTDTVTMSGGEDMGETFLAEVVSSSRVTIPKAVRHKLRIVEGDEVYVRIWKDEKVSKVATKNRFQRK